MKRPTYLLFLLLMLLLFVLVTSCSNDYDGPFKSDYLFYNKEYPDILLKSNYLSYTSADTIPNEGNLSVDYIEDSLVTHITITSTTPIDIVYFDGVLANSYEEEQVWYYGTTGEVYSAILDIPTAKVRDKGIYNGYYSFQLSYVK